MPYTIDLGEESGGIQYVKLGADPAGTFDARDLEPEKVYEVLLYPTHEGKTRQVYGKDLRKNDLQCPDGQSWVEWKAKEQSGAPDAMISYSWDLNWDYLVKYLIATIGPNAMVWIDILACAQHPIERGEMDEIARLPEVVNYSGKVIVMPVSGITTISLVYELN